MSDDVQKGDATAGSRGVKDSGVMLTAPHRKGCWGAEAGGFVCFYGTESRDVIGRLSNNGRDWYRFGCNDPACMAFALVRWDVLTAFVNAALSSEPAPQATPRKEDSDE